MKKNANVVLMIVMLTSWKISHLSQAKGQKKKSMMLQKTLEWIVWPIMAVRALNSKIGNETWI